MVTKRKSSYKEAETIMSIFATQPDDQIST